MGFIVAHQKVVAENADGFVRALRLETEPKAVQRIVRETLKNCKKEGDHYISDTPVDMLKEDWDETENWNRYVRKILLKQMSIGWSMTDSILESWDRTPLYDSVDWNNKDTVHVCFSERATKYIDMLHDVTA